MLKDQMILFRNHAMRVSMTRAWILPALFGAAAIFSVPAGHAAESGLGVSRAANQKIDISADSMEVRQSERVANFVGNVVAVQGDMTLKADSVKVFYSLQNQDSETTRIDRIDAAGSVHIESPRESASGNWGIYDVGRELLTLGGAVTLKRGETVVKGNRLELDLKTGKSRMVSASSADESGRVHGVFAPPEKTPQSDGKSGE